MIPLKLQVKNFLSYGSDLQEIDFGPYNLISLSGKNGHGKSALLDAMTWAVWGQARKVSSTSKPDEGLLRLGQRQMIVIFDFLFNENRYRVRREFTCAYGKNYAYLDFAMLGAEDQNDAIALTGKTIKETQKKIEEVLGLDFDSFINSAFLKQGQSNEFSKKSPKERKDILANILGLNRFENLKKAAQEKSKEFSSEKDGILKVCEHIEADLENLPDINGQLEKVDNELKDILNSEKVVQESFNRVTLDEEELIKKSSELEVVKAKLHQLNTSFLEIKKRFLSVISQWRLIHHSTLDYKDYEQIDRDKKRIKKELDEQQKKFQKLYSLKERYNTEKERLSKHLDLFDRKYSKLISEEQAKIEKFKFQEKSFSENNSKLQAQIEDIEKNISNFDNINKGLDAKLKSLLGSSESIALLEVKFERRKEFYHYLVANGNSIKAVIKEISNKKDLISDKESPSCPLCLQNLSISRKEYLQKQFVKDELLKLHKLNRIKQMLPKFKEYLLQTHETIKNYKKIAEEKKLNEVKISEFKKDLSNKESDFNKLEKEIKKVSSLILDSQDHLKKLEKESKDVYKDEDCLNIKKLTDELEKEIELLKYDQFKHKELQNLFEVLEKKYANFQNISEQKLLQKERSKIIADLSKSLKRCKLDLDELKGQEVKFKDLDNEKHELSKKKDNIKKEMEEFFVEKEKLFQEKGKLQAQKEKLYKEKLELKSYDKQLKEIEKEIVDYKDISKALGKDGIQALLIEEAIPEIEQEANILLSRLTNNQSQIFIESVRDLKKGGTKETLDIKISDSIGLRPYELFSGGEAFRIDFALRIAISKLLAKRAGTSLQTLIIDEGFGSQDEEGLNNIMECIYKIQDDFEKVIIVSHLPSMKEQFPVQFVVSKQPTGSHIEIIECA